MQNSEYKKMQGPAAQTGYFPQKEGFENASQNQRN